MEFCEKCGTLLTPKEGGNKLCCEKCGVCKEPEGKYVQVEETEEVVEEDVVVNEGNLNLPTTKVDCEKCDNNKAYFTVEQTRAADEPPTRIYTCTKCKHVWREYS